MSTEMSPTGLYSPGWSTCLAQAGTYCLKLNNIIQQQAERPGSLMKVPLYMACMVVTLWMKCILYRGETCQ